MPNNSFFCTLLVINLLLTFCDNVDKLFVSYDEKLSDIICKSDRLINNDHKQTQLYKQHRLDAVHQCTEHYHEQTWLGEQRHTAVNQLIKTDSFGRERLPDVISIIVSELLNGYSVHLVKPTPVVLALACLVTILDFFDYITLFNFEYSHSLNAGIDIFVFTDEYLSTNKSYL